MTDPELIRRAEAAGIAPCYLDWREQRTEVSAETLAAILAALDAVPQPPRERRGAGRPGSADPAPGRDGATVPGEAPGPRRPVVGVNGPALLRPVPAVVGSRRPA